MGFREYSCNQHHIAPPYMYAYIFDIPENRFQGIHALYSFMIQDRVFVFMVRLQRSLQVGLEIHSRRKFP